MGENRTSNVHSQPVALVTLASDPPPFHYTFGMGLLTSGHQISLDDMTHTRPKLQLLDDQDHDGEEASDSSYPVPE